MIALREKLNVERAGNIQRFGDLLAYASDFSDGLDVQALGGQYDCSVARMDSGVFDMFGDRVE